MPYDIAIFRHGMNVQVANADILRTFTPEFWKYHHPISAEQLKYHDVKSSVTKTSSYHMGDILYELEDVPGIWHEDALLDPMLIEYPDDPRPKDMFVICGEKRPGGEYLVIKDQSGIEQVVLRRADLEYAVKAAQIAAERLHIIEFSLLYGFHPAYFDTNNTGH